MISLVRKSRYCHWVLPFFTAPRPPATTVEPRPMRLLPLAPLLLMMTLLAHSGASQAIPVLAPSARVDLEHRGVGYPVFRIPALAVTRRGTLIAAYDGRPSMADLPSHIAVLVRRSID